MKFQLHIEATCNDDRYPPVDMKVEFVATDIAEARWLSEKIIPTYISERVQHHNTINFGEPCQWEEDGKGNWTVNHEDKDFKISVKLEGEWPDVEPINVKEVKRDKLTEDIELAIKCLDKDGDRQYEWLLLDGKLVLAKGLQKDRINAEQSAISLYEKHKQEVVNDSAIQFLILDNEGDLTAKMNTHQAKVVDYAVRFAEALGPGASVHVESHTVYTVGEEENLDEIEERIYNRITCHRMRTRALADEYANRRKLRDHAKADAVAHV